MHLFDESYEFSTQLEIDELLSDLPIELIKENIVYQINNPVFTNSNYLDIVIEKYEILKNSFEGNEESITKLNNYSNNLFEYVLKCLNDRLSLGIDIDYEFDELLNITDNLYNYFILNYTKNITKFFYKFITSNRKMLIDHYEKYGKKKDVTTMNLKKNLKNKEDVVILANLPSIVNYIKNIHIEPEEFVDYTMSDDNFEARFVRTLIRQGRLSGDFVVRYLEIMCDENDELMDDILVDIKMKLINKLT